MKTFLIILFFLVIYTGCSKNNAFHRFDITKMQEKSEDSLQSSRIHNNTQTDGVASVVHLNRIFPNKFKGKESFYVCMFTKSNNDNLKFILNGKQSIKENKLTSINEFSNLMSLNETWKEYYYVEFEKQNSKLSFSIENSLFFSDEMTFEKSEN